MRNRPVKTKICQHADEFDDEFDKEIGKMDDSFNRIEKELAEEGQEVLMAQKIDLAADAAEAAIAVHRKRLKIDIRRLQHGEALPDRCCFYNYLLNFSCFKKKEIRLKEKKRTFLRHLESNLRGRQKIAKDNMPARSVLGGMTATLFKQSKCFLKEPAINTKTIKDRLKFLGLW